MTSMSVICIGIRRENKNVPTALGIDVAEKVREVSGRTCQCRQDGQLQRTVVRGHKSTSHPQQDAQVAARLRQRHAMNAYADNTVIKVYYRCDCWASRNSVTHFIGI